MHFDAEQELNVFITEALYNYYSTIISKILLTKMGHGTSPHFRIDVHSADYNIGLVAANPNNKKNTCYFIKWHFTDEYDDDIHYVLYHVSGEDSYVFNSKCIEESDICLPISELAMRKHVAHYLKNFHSPDEHRINMTPFEEDFLAGAYDSYIL